jgi:hypothetical protein
MAFKYRLKLMPRNTRVIKADRWSGFCNQNEAKKMLAIYQASQLLFPEQVTTNHDCWGVQEYDEVVNPLPESYGEYGL